MHSQNPMQRQALQSQPYTTSCKTEGVIKTSQAYVLYENVSVINYLPKTMQITGKKCECFSTQLIWTGISKSTQTPRQREML